MQGIYKISSAIIKRFSHKGRFVRKYTFYKHYTFPTKEGRKSYILQGFENVRTLNSNRLPMYSNTHKRNYSINKKGIVNNSGLKDENNFIHKMGNFKPKKVLVLHIPPNSEISHRLEAAEKTPVFTTSAAIVSTNSSSENEICGNVEQCRITTLDFDKVKQEKLMLVPLIIYKDAEVMTQNVTTDIKKEEKLKDEVKEGNVIGNTLPPEVPLITLPQIEYKSNQKKVIQMQLPPDICPNFENVPLSAMKLDLRMTMPNVEEVARSYLDKKKNGLNTDVDVKNECSEEIINMTFHLKKQDSEESEASATIPVKFKAEFGGVLSLHTKDINSKKMELIKNVDFNSLVTAITGNVASMLIQKDTDNVASSKDTAKELYKVSKNPKKEATVNVLADESGDMSIPLPKGVLEPTKTTKNNERSQHTLKTLKYNTVESAKSNVLPKSVDIAAGKLNMRNEQPVPNKNSNELTKAKSSTSSKGKRKYHVRDSVERMNDAKSEVPGAKSISKSEATSNDTMNVPPTFPAAISKFSSSLDERKYMKEKIKERQVGKRIEPVQITNAMANKAEEKRKNADDFISTYNVQDPCKKPPTACNKKKENLEEDHKEKPSKSDNSSSIKLDKFDPCKKPPVICKTTELEKLQSQSISNERNTSASNCKANEQSKLETSKPPKASSRFCIIC